MKALICKALSMIGLRSVGSCGAPIQGVHAFQVEHPDSCNTSTTPPRVIFQKANVLVFKPWERIARHSSVSGLLDIERSAK
jgi:hypothetical protein